VIACVCGKQYAEKKVLLDHQTRCPNYVCWSKLQDGKKLVETFLVQLTSFSAGQSVLSEESVSDTRDALEEWLEKPGALVGEQNETHQ